jgi:hypothetical protein
MKHRFSCTMKIHRDFFKIAELWNVFKIVYELAGVKFSKARGANLLSAKSIEHNFIIIDQY